MSQLPPPLSRPESTGQPRGSDWWQRFRSWPAWVQCVAGLVLLPLVLAVFTVTRPAERRRAWWTLTAVVAIVWVAMVAAAGSPAPEQAETPEAEGAATTEPPAPTTTRESQPTTTTVPQAPEGGMRSGDGEDVSADHAAVGADQLDRHAATNDLLAVLPSLTVEPEHARSGYDRALFEHWDDEDHDGCDTRCEVLSAQRRTDGTWLSEWDGYSTDDPAELHVDHVVALAEAWDSGADLWSSAKRDEFSDHLANLLAVSAASNLRKSDKDAAEWFPSRAEANCLWASTVVRVKDRWSLSVDEPEAAALGNLLRACADYVPPTTTTAPPPPTTIAPTTTMAAPPPAPSSSCTPGYSPCIPDEGTDVDCAGGSGNGPRYVQGPVAVDHAYNDPYDLDRDGNGVGCQS